MNAITAHHERKPRPRGLGVVGCGDFAVFCLQAYAGMDSVRPVAAARCGKDRARRAVEAMGLRVYDDYGSVIDDPEVEIVHVATPPPMHPDLAIRALEAGRHVLCEKPLALTEADAQRMANAARAAGRFCAANFVLRYSPVVDAARAVLDTHVLGQVLAGRLVNCGSDSGLDEGHWFWDRSVSGGIFIEHGVHFFDLLDSLLAGGEVLSACAERRGDSDVVDRVGCTIRHECDAVVTHYHGFDQVSPMDRTELRLVCELGDVKLDGWIPGRLVVDAAVNEEGLALLRRCCASGRVETLEEFPSAPTGTPEILGRGMPHRVDRRVRLTYDVGCDKETLYADCLRWLLADQVAWADDGDHSRTVVEDDGVRSLRIAERATQLADNTREGRSE